MDEITRETFEYRWINGIRGHMHVISGGVDMHLALDDRRTVQEAFQRPDPTNGWLGVIRTTEELPVRESVLGLYAVSMVGPHDEFLVVDYEGNYKGRLDRDRDGMLTVFPLNRACDPRNLRFKSIPEALECCAEALNAS